MASSPMKIVVSTVGKCQSLWELFEDIKEGYIVPIRGRDHGRQALAIYAALTA